MMLEKFNQLKQTLTKNNKLMKLCDVINSLKAEVMKICEHCINFSHNQVCNDLKALLKWEAAIHTIEGHNKHENVGPIQEGGTMLLSFHQVNQFFTKTDSDHDPKGLGQWVSMAFKGLGGHWTQIFSAYNPCYNAKQDNGTSYQQNHCYFIRHHQDFTCPCAHLQYDLISQLTKWRQQGEHFILCMDANE